jgi:hypothetical protein
MLNDLSAAKLVKVFNAITDGKPVRKFEAQRTGIKRVRAEMERLGISEADALARAGMPVPAPAAPAELPEMATLRAALLTDPNVRIGAAVLRDVARDREAEKVLVRTEAWPYAKAVTETELPPDGPVDLITGKQLPPMRGVQNDPIRKAEGDPKKAARKVAKEAVAKLRTARETGVKRLSGRGLRAALKATEVPEVSPAPAPRKAKAPAPKATASAAPGGLAPEHKRLLTALINCKALADKPLTERAGAWVKYKAIHDSSAPHGLDNHRLPGLTRALRIRGLIDLRGSSANGEVCVTAAGLEA